MRVHISAQSHGPCTGNIQERSLGWKLTCSTTTTHAPHLSLGFWGGDQGSFHPPLFVCFSPSEGFSCSGPFFHSSKTPGMVGRRSLTSVGAIVYSGVANFLCVRFFLLVGRPPYSVPECTLRGVKVVHKCGG